MKTHWNWRGVRRTRGDADVTEAEFTKYAAEDRYGHFVRYSFPYCKRLGKLFPQPAFRQLCARIYELKIDVRVDAITLGRSWEEVTKSFVEVHQEPRSGLTLLEKRRRPLVVILEPLHRSWEDLLDTVFHELIHSTGYLLHRFEKQSDLRAGSAGYWLEEVTAIHGAARLGNLLNMRVTSMSFAHILKQLHLPASDIDLAERAGGEAAECLAQKPGFLSRMLVQTGRWP